MRLIQGPASIALTAASMAAAIGCHGRPIILVFPDSSVPPVLKTEEPDEVHFTFTGPTSLAFDWVGSGSTLRFWSDSASPHTIQAHAATPRPLSSAGPWQEAELTGLVPGGEYGYVIGDPARPLPASFHVPPAPGSSGFVFAAVGDIGASGDSPAVQPVQRLVSLAEPAFVLMLGDLTYADIKGQPAAQRHFEDVMAWSGRAAYMPVWGNHEWEDPARDDLRNYKGRFALPHPQGAAGAPAAGCCGEDWYWFDYGNVRFIVYPEPYTRATWDDWAARAAPLFAEAEGDPKLRFVVTAGHRPAYSSGHHGGDPQLRRILDGFGRRFPKYVLNLTGHSHVYERTKPQAHVVHITAGIGGSALEHATTPCLWNDCKVPSYTAFRAIHHGFLKVAVRATSIQIDAICGPPSPGDNDIRCADGDMMDQTTITAAP
jgi:Calcineurin-like phosphoesterase